MLMILIISTYKKIIIHLSWMSCKTWRKIKNKNNNNNNIHGAIIAEMTFNLKNMTRVKSEDSGWKYCRIIIITNGTQSVN